jgi:hypothetical protein
VDQVLRESEFLYDYEHSYWTITAGGAVLCWVCCAWFRSEMPRQQQQQQGYHYDITEHCHISIATVAAPVSRLHWTVCG